MLSWRRWRRRPSFWDGVGLSGSLGAGAGEIMEDMVLIKGLRIGKEIDGRVGAIPDCWVDLGSIFWGV